MQEQAYLPVNWADGMKINKTHFIAQENAFTSQLARYAGCMLNEYNYGLLSAPGDCTAGIKLFLSTDNHRQVQLRIQQCRAVTRGGFYIQFSDDEYLRTDYVPDRNLQLSIALDELKSKESVFYIVLSVNPYQRVACGMADFNELPARLPWSAPGLDLSLVPVQDSGQNILGLHQLPIGRLRVDDMHALLDTGYIPPCNAVKSHPDLLEFHAGIEQFYGRMEQYTLQIIQKILQKKQNSEMADIARKLCGHISIHIAAEMAEVKTAVHQSPLYLLNKISAFARLFKNTLDFFTGSGKEEFVNYCTEWCHINRGEPDAAIVALTNHLYDHLDTNAGIRKAVDFMKLTTILFSSLAQLEYIGKRRDAGIFVKEQLLAVEAERPLLRRSFLAD